MDERTPQHRVQRDNKVVERKRRRRHDITAVFYPRFGVNQSQSTKKRSTDNGPPHTLFSANTEAHCGVHIK